MRGRLRAVKAARFDTVRILATDVFCYTLAFTKVLNASSVSNIEPGGDTNSRNHGRGAIHIIDDIHATMR